MLMLFLTATRLTMNRPAVQTLGEPGAVRLSVVDGRAALRPTVPGEVGALELFDRDRGGRGCVVPHDAAQCLTDALHLSPARPYAMLRKLSPEGEFVLVHYERDGVPARHLAAVRLWFPPPSANRDAKVCDEDFADVDRDDADLPFAALVRRADAVVRRATHQLGRPSAEVVEARRVMAAFGRLMRDVRPDLFVDRAALEDDLQLAASALDRGIARLRADVT